MGFIKRPPEILVRIKDAVTKNLRSLVKTETPGEVDGELYRPREIRADEPVDSRSFNAEQQALSKSLTGLCATATAIDQTARQRENAMAEDLSVVRSNVLTLRNRIRAFSFLKSHPEFDVVRFVDFDAARNLSDRSPLAVIDPETRILSLARTKEEPIQIAGPTEGAGIDIRHVGGGVAAGFLDGFTPDRMLDDDDNTFWADLVLTKGPISQVYVRSDGESRVCHGLVTEVTVTLPELSSLNDLKLLPFGEYAVSVIDLAYREGNELSPWRPVPGFSEGQPGLDWLELRFPPVRASAIRIVLLQENYVTGVYHLPESVVRNTNALEKLAARSYLERVGTDRFTEAQAEKVTLRNEMAGWLDAVSEVSRDAVSRDLPTERVNEVNLTAEIVRSMAGVLAGADPEEAKDLLEPVGDPVAPSAAVLVEARTTEYHLGIRTLRLFHTEFAPVSYYASPAFDPGGSPVEVSLAAGESHPVFGGEDPHRLTSVEYEIDLGEGLRLPVLPVDAGAVTDEVLFVDRSTRKGYSRFLPRSGSILVRKNGERQPPETYSVALDQANRRAEVTILSGFSSTAVYTVSYAADDSALVLRLPEILTSTPVREPEVFAGGTAGRTFVRLAAPPFVAQEIVNDEVSWVKRDGDAVFEFSPLAGQDATIDGTTYSPGDVYEPVVVHVGGQKAVNITDYGSNLQPAFTNVDPASRQVQFLHAGRMLYFPFPIADTVTVSYRWMARHVKLVATLRSFKQGGVDVTPVIRSAGIRLNLAGV